MRQPPCFPPRKWDAKRAVHIDRTLGRPKWAARSSRIDPTTSNRPSRETRLNFMFQLAFCEQKAHASSAFPEESTTLPPFRLTGSHQDYMQNKHQFWRSHNIGTTAALVLRPFEHLKVAVIMAWDRSDAIGCLTLLEFHSAKQLGQQLLLHCTNLGHTVFPCQSLTKKTKAPTLGCPQWPCSK